MAEAPPKHPVKPSRTPAEILVALDGSENSRGALAAAIRLVHAFEARLHVLHVVPKLEEYSRHSELLSPLLSALDTVGKQVVEDAAMRAEEASVRPTTEVAHGVPPVEIAEYARRNGIQLIAIGSRGLNPRGAQVLGSVSYQVSMIAPCSVLVVKEANPFSRILLAVDGSPDSRRATEFVRLLGPKLDSKVTLTFIVPSRPQGVFTLAATPAEPFLLEAETALRKAGLAVVRDLRYGHPAEEIVKAGARHTLVALGARGRSDLSLDYVGGVADKVLRNSSVSTLVVR